MSAHRTIATIAGYTLAGFAVSAVPIASAMLTGAPPDITDALYFGALGFAVGLIQALRR